MTRISRTIIKPQRLLRPGHLYTRPTYGSWYTWRFRQEPLISIERCDYHSRYIVRANFRSNCNYRPHTHTETPQVYFTVESRLSLGWPQVWRVLSVWSVMVGWVYHSHQANELSFFCWRNTPKQMHGTTQNIIHSMHSNHTRVPGRKCCCSILCCP